MVVVKIADLTFDKTSYPRQDYDPERVREFAELMAEGVKFPAIRVGKDGLVLDGVHRLLAVHSLKREEIEVEVIESGIALLTSASLNATHGLPLTPREKERVAVTVLRQNPRLPLAEIAKALGVGVSSVQRWTKKERDEVKTVQSTKVKELAEGGCTQERIAAEVGMTQGAVSKMLHRDIPSPQVGEGNNDEEPLLGLESSPLPRVESDEIRRLKANLRPLEEIQALGEKAVCPDHGSERLQFSCGLGVEEALDRYANLLRLTVIKVREGKQD